MNLIIMESNAETGQWPQNATVHDESFTIDFWALDIISLHTDLLAHSVLVNRPDCGHVRGE